MARIKLFILTLIASVFVTQAVAQSEYLVRPGDTIVVEVLEDTSLNRSLVVLSDGRISFPFAGTLRVSGRTVGEIEASIRNGISSQFAAQPNVFVSIQPAPVEPRPVVQAQPEEEETIDIYFLGEVNNGGLIAVTPGTTFLQAMAQAGGLTRFAADKRVQLRRTDPSTGEIYMFEINYRAILDGARLRDNVELLEGDVIVVPERRLFE